MLNLCNIKSKSQCKTIKTFDKMLITTKSFITKLQQALSHRFGMWSDCLCNDQLFKLSADCFHVLKDKSLRARCGCMSWQGFKAYSWLLSFPVRLEPLHEVTKFLSSVHTTIKLESKEFSLISKLSHSITEFPGIFCRCIKRCKNKFFFNYTSIKLRGRLVFITKGMCEHKFNKARPHREAKNKENQKKKNVFFMVWPIKHIQVN